MCDQFPVLVVTGNAGNEMRSLVKRLGAADCWRSLLIVLSSAPFCLASLPKVILSGSHVTLVCDLAPFPAAQGSSGL